MIEPRMEYKYNVVLSVFLGIIVALLLNKLLNNRREVIVDKTNNDVDK